MRGSQNIPTQEMDEDLRAAAVLDLRADTIAVYETMGDDTVEVGPLKLDTLDDFAIALGFC